MREISGTHRPERLDHLPELPRTPVGKTDKKRLAADIARKVSTPQSGSSSQRRAGRRW
jgi:non-ribosomal peptide synthetase component E (peptide arylation enzyme)